MAKSGENFTKFLKVLQEAGLSKPEEGRPPGLSVLEITERMGLGRSEDGTTARKGKTAVYGYLAQAEKTGIVINAKKAGRTVYYSLEETSAVAGGNTPDRPLPESSGFTRLQEMTKDTFYRYHVMQELQKGPKNKEALLAGVLERQGKDPRKMSPDALIREENRLTRIIAYMTDRGDLFQDTAVYLLPETGYAERDTALTGRKAVRAVYILKMAEAKEADYAKGTPYAKETARYRLTCQNLPANLELDRDALEKLYYEMESANRNMPFSGQLRSIYLKAATLLGYNAEPDVNDENVTMTGREYTGIQEALDRLHLFDAVDYGNRTLYVSLKNKAGQIREHELAVGVFAFSVDKNRLYILGKRGGRDVLVSVENIVSVREGKKPNTRKPGRTEKRAVQNKPSASRRESADSYYESPECMERFAVSFDLSAEKPETVCVAFRDRPSVSRKIRYLKSIRKGAVLSHEDGRLVYRDKIRGLSDFAMYLRQYGADCRVLEPESLKTMLSKTAIKTLNRYGEVPRG